MLIKSINDLQSYRTKLKNDNNPEQTIITVCGGTGCHAYNCNKLIQTFKAKLSNNKHKIKFRVTGCLGFCERGPIVLIKPKNIFYQKVKDSDVSEIIDSVIDNTIIKRLLYKDSKTSKMIELENDVHFYKKQKRIVFGTNAELDPKNIHDYIVLDGYTALEKVLSDSSPEKVINEIQKSGLRGRGGGGFPTGKKWEYCRNAAGTKKYVICNADEGDPGAYMDQSLLEGNPHSIIEGMIIGAYAIGANEGYIYVRNEYPLAVENIKFAVKTAEKYGLLGKNILGTGFDFNIIINRGGGAFVCGESSALIASIEGRIGEPRFKYIHATNKGLWDKPTCLNNVETWANVPLIINKGADWYNKIGTKSSKGTKIFSLVGKVVNTGLVEVPMGITLNELINDIGGGVGKNRKLKAVQTGGPSGGCIPAELTDIPIDFDELNKVGSMMGSGGLVVMDDETCMVDTAKYFLDFTIEESCGKCVPCREGVYQMQKILDCIIKGNGTEKDIDTLEELGKVIQLTALCALGRTAPNPVLSTLKYFRDEYFAHIKDKKCPAGVCKALITYKIDIEKCTGCTLCARECPENAITGNKKEVHKIDTDKCIKCGICYDVCNFDAVIK